MMRSKLVYGRPGHSIRLKKSWWRWYWSCHGLGWTPVWLGYPHVNKDDDDHYRDDDFRGSPCGFLRSQCQSLPPSSSEECRTHSVVVVMIVMLVVVIEPWGLGWGFCQDPSGNISCQCCRWSPCGSPGFWFIMMITVSASSRFEWM